MNNIANVKKSAPLRNVAAFSTLITRMVERSQDLPGLACFYGPSGYGKTKSAIYGVNHYRAPYVECGQFTTAKTLMQKILSELGVMNAKGTIEHLKDEAIYIMAKDPRLPLIIDEAHYIAHKSFINVIGELQRKSGAPILLIGEETLPKQLERFERVDNCVLEWVPAVECDQNDFDMLLTVSYEGLQIAPNLAAEILKKTNGNTRRIVVNLARAEEISKTTKDGSVSLEDFGGIEAINAGRAPAPRRIKR